MNLREIEEWWRGRPVVHELKQPIFGYWEDITDWLIVRVKELDLALQSLTPGGSEFVNDPERCVAYCREIRNSQLRQIIKLSHRVKELEEQLQTSRDAHADTMNGMGKKVLEWEEATKKHKSVRRIRFPEDRELYAHLKEGEDGH